MTHDSYCETVPELVELSRQCQYGGITGRPYRLKGYLTLPDGRRFWLGEIAVKYDGWGDGLITDVVLEIRASKFELEISEEQTTENGAGNGK